MAYHRELTMRGVKVHLDNDTDDSMSSSRRWLKGVEVERISVSSSDTGSEKSWPIFRPDDDRKPCLSKYERDGLLALLQTMKEQGLFFNDIPPSCRNPTKTIKRLQKQLHSSSLGDVCPLNPSGRSLMSIEWELGGASSNSTPSSSPRKRKRTRKSLESGKRAKREGNGGGKAGRRKSEPSVVVSLPISLLSPPKSQGEEEDEDGGVNEQFNPLQLTPDYSPIPTPLSETPPTQPPELAAEDYSSPLVSSSSPSFSLVLEQESPCLPGQSIISSHFSPRTN